MPNASVHPTAIIEDGARVGSDVRIGPYCVVGSDVVLGDGVELLSHVVVAGRTSIGARTRILNAASELFYCEGINATGVGRIASNASVSKRTLYQHFPSKTALVEEYLCQLRQEAGEAKRTSAEKPDTTPRAQLLALFDIADAGDARMRGCLFHNAAVNSAGVSRRSSTSSTCTSATTWMGSSTWPDRRARGTRRCWATS